MLSLEKLAEHKIPKANEIFLTDSYIYLLSEEPSSEFLAKKLDFEIEGREVITLSSEDPGDLGPGISLGNRLFVPNGSRRLYIQEGIETLLQIHVRDLMKDHGFEFYEMGTDGTFLYLEINDIIKDSPIMVTTDLDLNIINKFRTEYCDFLDGNGRFFMTNTSNQTDVYFQGQKIDDFVNEKNPSFRELLGCAISSQSEEISEYTKLEAYNGIKPYFPIESFTDGKNYYQLIQNGEIWMITSKKNDYLVEDGAPLPDEVNGFAIHNGTNAFLAFNGEYKLIKDGKILSKGLTNFDNDKIVDSVYNQDLILILEEDKIISYQVKE